MSGFSNLSLPRWPEEDAPLALPAGFHPDGVLGGLNLGGPVFDRDAWANGTHFLSPFGIPSEHPTDTVWQEREISPPALNPNDPIFRMPQLPIQTARSRADTELTASEALRSYLRGREKFEPKAYNDNPKHPDRGTMTIGYGHTQDVGTLSARYPNGIPEPVARSILDADILPAIAAVRRNLRVPVSQNQFDALVDYAFNAGAGALASSPMLQHLNAGNPEAAADAFATSRITQKGQVLQGLKNRRADEADMFRLGSYTRR